MTGIILWLAAKTSRSRVVSREEFDRVTEALGNVNDQLYAVRESMSELHERVDFAERLLTKGEKDR